MKYFVLSVTGAFSTMNIPEYFGTFTGTGETIGWHAAAVLGTMGIVLFGVQRGIEKANKIMMPVLFGILIILLIRSVTLPGAGDGLAYMFVPDWAKLAETETWVMALGQAFFTLSLGGATMLVYGSYARDDTDIPSASIQTVLFNFIASLLAAFAIIPAVFAFGLWADIATVYVLPFGALVSAVVFFWIFGADKARAEINKNAVKQLGIWFEPYAKYVFVSVALLVMILNIAFGGIG